MTEEKKRVLIISFWFPPINNPGALRIGKFAKYLTEFGWEPIILTVDRHAHISEIGDTQDTHYRIIRAPYLDLREYIHKKLSGKKLSSTTSAVNTAPKRKWVDKTLNAMRILRPIYAISLVQTLFRDPHGWYPYAMKRGLEIATGGQIALIFSTYGPSTCHFAASRIHQKTGIPWVAEFRDPWAFNSMINKIQPFHSLEKQLEIKVMRGCSQLITVSEPLAQKLETLHHKDVSIICNGFDEEDFLEDVPLTSKFTITYTGSIYNGRRDPTPLFEAICRLKNEGKIKTDSFILRFYGSGCPFLTNLVTAYKLEDMVEVHESIPYSDSISKQMESSVLLFLGWDDPSETWNLTTKVFEYLGARRPILSLSKRTEAVSVLVERSGYGIVANDVESIEGVLLQWVEEFSKTGEIITCFKPDTEIRNSYTRRAQTRKLAELFDKVFG